MTTFTFNLPDGFDLADLVSLSYVVYDYAQDSDAFATNQGIQWIDMLISIAAGMGHDGQNEDVQNMACLRDELVEFIKPGIRITTAKQTVIDAVDNFQTTYNPDVFLRDATDEQISRWHKRLVSAEGADWYDIVSSVVDDIVEEMLGDTAD